MEVFLFILRMLAVIVVFLLAIILIRTFLFRPKKKPYTVQKKVSFDKDAPVRSLQALVRCKTVSNRDPALEDDAEFEKLINLLPTLFPLVHKTCTLTRMDGRALLYLWEGKAHDAPTVLMSHYDVVPADEDKWKKPPYEGILEDGVLWGRGTLDTKVTMNAALSAAEHLISKKFVPAQDIYFAFSGGEEINGRGALNIVEWFERRGITPDLVLDEGGAVVQGVFPGVSAPCGMIGIAEKGMMDVELSVRSNGGHSSAPKPHTPVGLLSCACCRMENHPFPTHLTKPVAEMFDTLGRHSSFLYRMIFANLWAFGDVLDIMCKTRGGELNALMRTTVAFTQMEGSPVSNVIPPEAKMVANIRLNPEDTIEDALDTIRATIKNDNISVRSLRGTNPSRISETDCAAWQKVVSSVEGTWEGALVTPYLMVQCSDSRHWGRISDRVYRFSAMDLTTEERATIHGHDERIRVETLLRSVEFYIRLMKQC